MITPETDSKRRFSWLGCLGIAALLLLLVALLFPAGGFPTRGAAKRAQARNEVAQICTALKYHLTEFGSLPSGDNAQIMTVLRGANSRSIVFFEAAANRFNARGEYLDPWKTPFHIDVSNPTFPWSYSFGEDTKDNGGVPESDDIPSWR